MFLSIVCSSSLVEEVVLTSLGSIRAGYHLTPSKSSPKEEVLVMHDFEINKNHIVTERSEFL